MCSNFSIFFSLKSVQKNHIQSGVQAQASPCLLTIINTQCWNLRSPVRWPVLAIPGFGSVCTLCMARVDRCHELQTVNTVYMQLNVRGRPESVQFIVRHWLLNGINKSSEVISHAIFYHFTQNSLSLYCRYQLSSWSWFTHSWTSQSHILC